MHHGTPPPGTSFAVYPIGVSAAKSDTIAAVAQRIDHSRLMRMLDAAPFYLGGLQVNRQPLGNGENLK